MAKTPHIRFRIDFSEHSSIGPGKIALLEAIKECGSVSEAARRLDLSYRRAWLLLDSLNRTFDTPVTVNSVGGRGGGGAEVTAFGERLIERYREFESEITLIGRTRLKDLLPRIVYESSAGDALKPTSITKRRRDRQSR